MPTTLSHPCLQLPPCQCRPGTNTHIVPLPNHTPPTPTPSFCRLGAPQWPPGYVNGLQPPQRLAAHVLALARHTWRALFGAQHVLWHHPRSVLGQPACQHDRPQFVPEPPDRHAVCQLGRSPRDDDPHTYQQLAARWARAGQFARRACCSMRVGTQHSRGCGALGSLL